MGAVQSSKPGSLRGRTARLAGLSRTGGPEGVSGDESGAYDPSGYTVDEVIAYGRAHPDEAEAILKLEKGRDGKQRKGVIEALG